MIKFRQIKENDITYSHTNVYENGVFIGYIIKERECPVFRMKWYFYGTDDSYFRAKTKKEIIETVKMKYNEQAKPII